MSDIQAAAERRRKHNENPDSCDSPYWREAWNDTYAPERLTDAELLADAYTALASRALLAERRLAAVTECRDYVADMEKHGGEITAPILAVIQSRLTQALETK